MNKPAFQIKETNSISSIGLFCWMAIIATVFAACQAGSASDYAIRDFPASLRPSMHDIVLKGIVNSDDTAFRFLTAHATDRELQKLSSSEHPLLRAVAFRILSERPDVDHFDMLMRHLNDTAIVTVDAGEWGKRFTTVSDDLIQHSTWKSIEEKNKTIDKVIREYNYLQSAYTILYKLGPIDKYYTFIRQMAQQDRHFEEIEDALYALARYKKPEDVHFIKMLLLDGGNNWRMGTTSFDLLQNFPNEAYMDVMEKYSKKNFYYKICSGHRLEDAVEFVETVAGYKNQRSAIILSKFMNQKPFVPCPNDSAMLRSALNWQVWSNQCETYATLVKSIRPYMEALERKQHELDKQMATLQPEIVEVDETSRW